MNKPEKKSSDSGTAKKTGEKIPQKSRSKGKTARQIMTRHIKDEKDVITEEEFKNLDTAIDLSKDTVHEPLEIPENKEHPKDEDKDPKIVTPWDVIT